MLVAVLLRLSASPPPYHHLLPPNTTTTTTARQPSPPHLHPLKLLPKHSYATLLALIPHRRTHGTRTALAASLLRFRPSASHSPPPHPSIVPSGIHPATRYPGSTTPVRRPRATDSLTPSSVLRRTRPRCFDVGIPASRIPPCTSGAIGKAIARLTREDLQQEKGALAYEHPVWKFACERGQSVRTLLPFASTSGGTCGDILFGETPIARLRSIFSWTCELGYTTTCCTTASATFVQGLSLL